MATLTFVPEAGRRGQAPGGALARELRQAIQGEVRFDQGSRALYATDASNYRQVPFGVVIPRSKEDVIRTVEVCRKHGAPVLPRGGGTSLCGQCCNVAVVLDFSKYLNRVLAIDPVAKTARVEPGVVLDDLRRAAGAHGLTFAPDPATHTHNTIVARDETIAVDNRIRLSTAIVSSLATMVLCVCVAGSGAKVRPWAPAARRRSSSTTPGSTRAVFATGSIASTRFRYFEKSSTTATLQHCPQRLVPPPRGSTGAPCFLQTSTVRITSSFERGITTPNGTWR